MSLTAGSIKDLLDLHFTFYDLVKTQNELVFAIKSFNEFVSGKIASVYSPLQRGVSFYRLTDSLSYEYAFKHLVKQRYGVLVYIVLVNGEKWVVVAPFNDVSEGDYEARIDLVSLIDKMPYDGVCELYSYIAVDGSTKVVNYNRFSGLVEHSDHLIHTAQ